MLASSLLVHYEWITYSSACRLVPAYSGKEWCGVNGEWHFPFYNTGNLEGLTKQHEEVRILVQSAILSTGHILYIHIHSRAIN